MTFNKIKRLFLAAPAIIFSSSALAVLLTNGARLPLTFLVGEIIFGYGANQSLKRTLKFLNPTHKDWIRPVDHPAIGCGSFPNFEYDRNSQSFGMPSGHAQISSFAATFFTIVMLKRMKEGVVTPTQALSTITILWLMQIMVGGMRISVKCHTIKQVVVGTVIGAIFAWFYTTSMLKN
jgi:membrane-associated phospholipid phosphatase